jgi:hypothetical protein
MASSRFFTQINGMLKTLTIKKTVRSEGSLARWWELTMAVELSVLKQATKYGLESISKQASTLAIGLQNAAPPQEGGPGKSILYLGETANQIEDLSRKIDV